MALRGPRSPPLQAFLAPAGTRCSAHPEAGSPRPTWAPPLGSPTRSLPQAILGSGVRSPWLLTWRCWCPASRTSTGLWSSTKARPFSPTSLVLRTPKEKAGAPTASRVRPGFRAAAQRKWQEVQAEILAGERSSWQRKESYSWRSAELSMLASCLFVPPCSLFSH